MNMSLVNNKLNIIIITSILFVFIGCTKYKLIDANKRVQLGREFTVNSSIVWNKVEMNGVETWTIDGPNLQRIMFFQGIEHGEPLLNIKQEKNIPQYKSSMTSFEIKELFVATLNRSGAHKIITKDFRPQKFGNLDGFRFEFTYTTKNGLKYNGFVVGAQKDKALLAIMYTGAALHYYKKHLDDANNIVSSVVVL